MRLLNRRTPEPLPDEKSIAVLPFENLSAEKDDAFFADGIQDDVLTSVGKIKGLKVIARASVMDYRGAQLGRKGARNWPRRWACLTSWRAACAGLADRVVMNVALIDTRDERQVWSERYERTLTDTISLQGELAIEIARALHATLTPAEATVAAAKPTQNPEAYLLYLRAREIEIRNCTPEQASPRSSFTSKRSISIRNSRSLVHAFPSCASRLFDTGRGAGVESESSGRSRGGAASAAAAG